MPTPRVAFRPCVILSNEDDVLIDFNKRIGEWAYGPLYEGHSKSQKRKVMVKIVDLKKFPLQKKCLDTEIDLLKKLQGNKYVINFADYRYYQNTLTLTTDIYNKGNLRAYLKKRAPLSEIQALDLLLKILHGLKPLHEMDFCHGAIRPENILLHEDEHGITPKLTTFVFARKYSAEPIKKAQLPYDSTYLSPEALKDLHYSSKSDIWAIGVLYYEMLYGRTPWVGKNNIELEKKIANDILEFPVDDSISEASTSFISKCLERDPVKRLSWGDLVVHRLIFRGMFAGGDGTYRTTNKQFQEETPTTSRLVYGLRRNDPNSSMRINTKSFVKQQSGLKVRCETHEPDTADQETALLTANDDTRFRTDENIKAERQTANPINMSIQSVPSQCEKSKSASILKNITRSSVKKVQDEKFYSRYVSSVATPEEYYMLASMQTQKSARGKYAPTFSKAYTAPFRQTSLKVEMLGDLYELLHKNKSYSLFDKIQHILDEEAHKLSSSVKLLANISHNFGKSLEKTLNQSLLNGSLTDRKPKTTLSVPKKKKCPKILRLLEEILATITDHGNTNTSASTDHEDIMKIAANLKVMREFEDIGEDMQKKLVALKDLLQMFYRQKHYDHLRYLLLVKNFV